MAIKNKIPSPSEFANQVKEQNQNPTINKVEQPNTEKIENQTNPTTNNQIQKFTPEEINKIESLQQELNQITFQLGQLEISKIKLKQSENQLLNFLTEIEKKEKNLASELNKKYGKGTLDTKTGEFTPTK
jgi:23S rRNA maturation-related 3'-5' exoribonuclease YhaM